MFAFWTTAAAETAVADWCRDEEDTLCDCRLFLTFHCLSLSFHCLSLTFHCRLLFDHDLSMPFHYLSLTLHRLFTASSLPPSRTDTAFRARACVLSLPCFAEIVPLPFVVFAAATTSRGRGASNRGAPHPRGKASRSTGSEHTQKRHKGHKKAARCPSPSHMARTHSVPWL